MNFVEDGRRRGRGSGKDMLVIFLIVGANYLTRNSLKKGLISAHKLRGYHPSQQGKLGIRRARQLVMLYLQEGSRGQTGSGA